MNEEKLKEFNIELQALCIKYSVTLEVEAKIVVVPKVVVKTKAKKLKNQ